MTRMLATGLAAVALTLSSPTLAGNNNGPAGPTKPEATPAANTHPLGNALGDSKGGAAPDATTGQTDPHPPTKSLDQRPPTSPAKGGEFEPAPWQVAAALVAVLITVAFIAVGAWAFGRGLVRIPWPGRRSREGGSALQSLGAANPYLIEEEHPAGDSDPLEGEPVRNSLASPFNPLEPAAVTLRDMNGQGDSIDRYESELQARTEQQIRELRAALEQLSASMEAENRSLRSRIDRLERYGVAAPREEPPSPANGYAAFYQHLEQQGIRLPLAPFVAAARDFEASLSRHATLSVEPAHVRHALALVLAAARSIEGGLRALHRAPLTRLFDEQAGPSYAMIWPDLNTTMLASEHQGVRRDGEVGNQITAVIAPGIRKLDPPPGTVLLPANVAVR